MIKNLIVIAARYFFKYWSYSLINILGLSLGLATCILIFLFVQDEFNYDRFHDNADNIYRLEYDLYFEGQAMHWAATTGNVVPFVADNFPEVVAACKMNFVYGQQVVEYKELSFREDNVVAVDSTFFDVFSFKIINGSKQGALAGPSKTVVSESVALKYFGQNNPIGEVIKLNGRNYKITAVTKDVPVHSHFHYDILIPLDDARAQGAQIDRRGPFAYYSYIRLPDKETKKKLKEKMDARLWETFGLIVSGPDANVPEGSDGEFVFVPITDIHLKSHVEKEIEVNGDIQYIYIFSIIAIFVLLIACINYMNLATARSAHRGREVGVRKVLGANKTTIFKQFMGESYVMSLLALLFSLLFVELILPGFNTFTSKTLILSVFSNIPLLQLLIIVFFVVGFLSGSYPAVFLSKFNPLKVLKSNTISGSSNKSTLYLRRGLVVFQFSISVLLIIGAITVYTQLRYIQTKDLGFNKEQVVVLNLTNTIRPEQIKMLKNEFRKEPSIVSATSSSVIPGERVHMLSVRFPDLREQNIEGNEEEDIIGMRVINADVDVVETFGLEIVEGRNFSEGYGTDEQSAFLINEAGVKAFQLENPVGSRFEYLYGLRVPKSGNIVGVLKDFHYASLHSDIEPVIVQIMPQYNRYMSVRINPGNIKETLAKIENSWEAVFPNLPIDFFFLDTSYDNMYKTEMSMGTIITYFTILAIIIACLGLFGLASYITEQKTKEVGIRKVLGASIISIINSISKEFLVLIVIANIIAYLPAYYFLDNWLSDFAYRVNINLGVFLITSVLSILIAVLTVSSQAMKTARMNPVDTLKYE